MFASRAPLALPCVESRPGHRTLGGELKNGIECRVRQEDEVQVWPRASPRQHAGRHRRERAELVQLLRCCGGPTRRRGAGWRTLRPIDRPDRLGAPEAVGLGVAGDPELRTAVTHRHDGPAPTRDRWRRTRPRPPGGTGCRRRSSSFPAFETFCTMFIVSYGIRPVRTKCDRSVANTCGMSSSHCDCRKSRSGSSALRTRRPFAIVSTETRTCDALRSSSQRCTSSSNPNDVSPLKRRGNRDDDRLEVLGAPASRARPRRSCPRPRSGGRGTPRVPAPAQLRVDDDRATARTEERTPAHPAAPAAKPS